MKKTTLVLIPVLSGLLMGPATAQSLDRTPQAAVEDLLADGLVSNVSLFLFRGCPQEDPEGRAIFSAVRDMEVEGYGSVQLVRALSQSTYPDCGYEPLNTWIVEMVDRWHARGDAGSLDSFARNLEWLEVTITPDLQEALLRAAEDEAFASAFTRDVIAAAALRYGPPESRLEVAIAAFATNIPDRTKTSWTYQLGREHRSEFFQAFAAAAPSLSDDDLFPIVSAISSDVQDGRIPPNADGLAQLRAEIARRPGLPPWAQIGTAVAPPIESNGPPVDPGGR